MQTSYRSRLRRATWLAFVVPLAAAAAGSVLLRSVAPGQHFWPVLTGLLVVGALAMWACLPWWNRLDDMQKQGHMVSWYWGGLGGGIAGLMWVVAAVGVHGAMAVGALIVFLAEAAGFLLFLVIWALRRSGPAA